MKLKNLFIGLIVSITCISCDSSQDRLGSEKNPVKLYFAPAIDGEEVLKNSKHLVSFLEYETGLKIKAVVPPDNATLIEDFGLRKVDMAFMNSFGYVIASERFGALAKLKTIRHGREYYRSQILTRDTTIKNIQDLQGKVFVYTEPMSTSGYIVPKSELDKREIIPSNTLFAMGHDEVVRMIYQGQVDAGATYFAEENETEEVHDARWRVMDEYPDVMDKVVQIWVSDELPNDPIVFRKDFPVKDMNNMITAIKKYIHSSENKQRMLNLYDIEGFKDCTDKDYDMLRETFSDYVKDYSKGKKENALPE